MSSKTSAVVSYRSRFFTDERDEQISNMLKSMPNVSVIGSTSSFGVRAFEVEIDGADIAPIVHVAADLSKKYGFSIGVSQWED